MNKIFRNKLVFVVVLLLIWVMTACQQAPTVTIDPAAAEVLFSGERALAIETAFVTTFPDRDSGQPNNRLATDWLGQEFSDLGLICTFDAWEVINHSRPLPLRNLICQLPGASAQQIVLVAHHDQSPKTIYGADNDGSGIAIMLHLAEIFAAEEERPYTLVFVSADGEEWGMLGSQRFIKTHPDPSQIIAGISLDNLGKEFYDGLNIDPTGQKRGIGALWLQRLSQDASKANGNLWIPVIYSPLDQMISQAVPISVMDQGPLVAAGVPAFGFAGRCPGTATELCWDTFHSPDDTLAHQSPVPLFHSGGNTEALVRQLFAQDAFPQESGPYIYFENSESVLRGLPLWAIFVSFVAVFFVASLRLARKNTGRRREWRTALIHYLALWLPLLGAILLLYLFVEIGLMDKWDTYPSTSKGDPIYYPRWPAVILWICGLSLLLWGGRRLGARLLATTVAPDNEIVKSLALLVVGLGGLSVLWINAFSLFLMAPMLAWLLLGLRRGWRRVWDIMLFLVGGALIIYMFYVFGWGFLRNDFAVLWYLMMMFSIRMIGFRTALLVTAMLAAGLTMVVNPPLLMGEAERKAIPTLATD